MDFFLQLTINGILLGGFYAMMTVGFSTIWGVMNLINLAHGEFLLMGAYVAWFFFNPSREQSIYLGGKLEQVESTIQFVMIITALLSGALLSERVIGRQRIARRGWRIMIGLLIAAVIHLAIYTAWRDAEQFRVVEISMLMMIPLALALSIGFLLSHVGLSDYVPDIWMRRALGYGIGAVVVFIGWKLWENGGFQSIDPFLTLPLIFVIFFALGYALQNSLFNRLIEGPFLTMLLVTFSVSIILQNIGLQLYAADPRKINIDYGVAYALGETGLTVPPVKLLASFVSIFMIGGVVLFLRRTRTGYAIRAAAQHKMAARLMGIDINETYAITFGLALAVTAMAGAMMGTFQPITPVTGAPFTLRAFAIVALGGLGRVQGVIVGGMVLGLAESYIGGYIGLGWAIAAAFILLVVMLVVNPRGITGGLAPQES